MLEPSKTRIPMMIRFVRASTDTSHPEAERHHYKIAPPLLWWTIYIMFFCGVSVLFTPEQDRTFSQKV